MKKKIIQQTNIQIATVISTPTLLCILNFPSSPRDFVLWQHSVYLAYFLAFFVLFLAYRLKGQIVAILNSSTFFRLEVERIAGERRKYRSKISRDI